MTNNTNSFNASARWFRRVAWIGILFNFVFVAMQFFAPDLVNVSLGVPVTGTTAWNVAHGAMVLALSLLYIPAAVSPLRYPAYSWLIVVSRWLAVVLWLSLSRTTSGFIQCAIADGSFGLVEGILLQLALPQESRISLHNFANALRSWWQGVKVTLARRAVQAGLGGVVVLATVVGYILWDHLLRAEPDTYYSSIEDHYKHGAIGLSAGSRVPYWIWKVLPDMFPEKLPGPGGWASLGLIMEDGQDLPVGFAKRKIGYEAVEGNCSLCHTAQIRRTPESKPELVLGGPAHTLDLEQFQRFLYGCAADPRFNSGNVIASINKIHNLGFVESTIYRFFIIPATKAGLMQQKVAYSWQESRPEQGRGRTDTFNPTKINVFHMPDDGTIGTVDLPQVWNQKLREKMYLHWDGNNNNIHERNYAAAMAIGATPQSVIPDSFKRVTDFLLMLQPPPYPFAVDKSAVERGRPIYAQHCASCHAFEGDKTGHVDAIASIGTDRHRLDSFTQGLVDRLHDINSPPFKFDAYRKTNGYANVPLDGIWVRAPYLHNGSVPSLQALLQPEKDRPTTFYKGYDVYDPVHVGFVSDGAEAQKVGFFMDTNISGNSNQGHTYGVNLSENEKRDLIEYLKTL